MSYPTLGPPVGRVAELVSRAAATDAGDAASRSSPTTNGTVASMRNRLERPEWSMEETRWRGLPSLRPQARVVNAASPRTQRPLNLTDYQPGLPLVRSSRNAMPSKRSAVLNATVITCQLPFSQKRTLAIAAAEASTAARA